MLRSSYLPLLLVASICAGCGADTPAGRPQPGAVDAVTEQPRSAEATTAVGEAYSVDPSRSEVFWRISKAGVMARFGHNHVISARQFSGTVLVPADRTQSRFELEIPVAALVVDEPELRARFGEEFASVPSEADIQGTRNNMLGDGVLKAAMFPVVRVRGGELMGDGAAQTAAIQIEILGNTFDFRVPCAVTFEEGSLEARGEFGLDHAELGMMPFSALGGALQVGERLEFTYRIRAAQTASQ
jgi:hypothetical protein